MALSVVTVAEMLFGARRSANSGRSVFLCKEFCASFAVSPLSYTAAELSAIVRADLENAGRRIGSYDVLIAGIALAETRVLVTHNTREFGRVRDLKIEDWLT